MKSFLVKINGFLGFLERHPPCAGIFAESPGTRRFSRHTEGIPFFVFDEANYTRGYAGQFFAISSYSNFMVHNTQVTQNEYYNELWFGLMGSVNEVPFGFSLETIISYSNKGFAAGMDKWGSTLRKRYGKTLDKRESDMTANYLSYWTDNGAFYYYHTDQSDVYEDQLEKIAKQDIPFQSWNYDSWWYFKDAGDHGGVVNWTAMPSVFPNGMEETFEKTHLPVTAHNRWWSASTSYAKQNGGQYDFIVQKGENETALPTTIDFWRDLFANATSWGLKVYEQDWLNKQTEKLEELTTSATLGRDWLMQMGQAAEEHGINILYCMAMPRHMLQSLEIPAVTIIRVSDDYHPGNRQWDIGISTTYSNALGLAPFKDVFWTTKDQPGNPRYGDKYEFRTYLQTIVATLSTGPVGIGDQIGKTDMKLLNRTMMPDGRILKPSVPASIPDILIWTLDTKLYLNGTTEWFTYSHIGDTNETLFDLTMAFAESNPPFISHQPPHKESKNYMAVTHTGEFSYYKGQYGDEMKYRNVGNYSELVVVFSGSPIWKMGTQLNHEISLFGETTSKMTSVSPVRFARMDIDPSHIYIDMNGVEEEVIILEWLIDEVPTQLNCTVPVSGKVSANVIVTSEDKVNLFCEDI